jgi:hypothetical protein
MPDAALHPSPASVVASLASRGAPTGAVGALRDALSSITNLVRLLQSRNVAPKAIAQVLVELPAACDGLVSQFEELAARRLPGMDTSLAHAQLSEFLAAQVNAFRNAIERAMSRTMNAATRLTLENALRPITANLSGALPLVELWTDLHGEWKPVDVVELLSLSRVGDQPQTPSAVAREVVLQAEGGLPDVSAPPRALLNWMGLVTSLADPKKQALSFTFTAHPEAQAPARELHIRPQPRAARGFSLLVPPLVEPTAITVVEAGAVLGLNIRVDDSAVDVAWR